MSASDPTYGRGFGALHPTSPPARGPLTGLAATGPVAELEPEQGLDGDHEPEPGPDGFTVPPASGRPGALVSPELNQALADVKGQAQFLLYLAEQIEESLTQLETEAPADPSQAAFLCRVLAMYSNQLEAKHHGLGERIAETCQEVYVTVREFDMELGHQG